MLIFNLTIADLIVTFVMIPLEIGWRLTQSWIAGDFMCKIMMTLRAFGPYLSSMVLVCISLDRYFAIIHPFKSNNTERSKKMLIFAWIISLVCSLPQVSRWYFYFFIFISFFQIIIFEYVMVTTFSSQSMFFYQKISRISLESEL